MSSSARRSQRLLKKRNASHAATDPAPGAYSPYDDGYVVESEASFLPPPTPSPDSRRARYMHSPHRLVDDSPPAVGTATPPPVVPAPSAGAGAAAGQRRPRAASAADPSVVDRVSASLFDILGSATRAPVNTSFRPPAKARRATAHPSLPRPIADDDDDDNNDDDDVVDTDDEDDVVVKPSAARPPRSHQPMAFPPGPVNRTRTRSATNPARGPSARQAPRASAGPTTGRAPARARAETPQERVRARARVAQMPTITVRPVAAMALLLALSIAVLLGLDARLCARRAGCEPLATRLVPALPGRLSAAGVAARLPRLSCGKTCMGARAAVSSLLLRAASRPALVSFRAADSERRIDIPADLVTRAQLAGEFEPRVLAAARKAAELEAARVVEEAAAAAAAARGEAGDAAEADGMDGGADDAEAGAGDEEEAFARFVERYAADKDLPADFALGSAGGAVIGSEPSALLEAARFARAYAASVVSPAMYTPVWPVGAGEVIRPSVLPGNCWSFRGSRGSVTIRLALPVRVSAVTVEHTPQRSVFSVRAAVREVRVVALPLGGGADTVVGEFEYAVGDGARHLQTFEAFEGAGETVARAVRFEVLSNHGAAHTAVYRLRVHGEQVEVDERGAAVLD